MHVTVHPVYVDMQTPKQIHTTYTLKIYVQIHHVYIPSNLVIICCVFGLQIATLPSSEPVINVRPIQ